jgi:hypothetical protein
MQTIFSLNLPISEINDGLQEIFSQKRYNCLKLPPLGTISVSPALIQAWAINLPFSSFATPKEMCDSIFRRLSMHWAARELIRHLFFHGDTLAARSVASFILSSCEV